MNTYIVLMRGINVGGKNKVPMAALKQYLEEDGFKNVMSYIQSGNIILQSPLSAKKVGDEVEALLSRKFKLDSPSIKSIAIEKDQLKEIVANRPKGFGDEPDKYYSDVIFLMGVSVDETMPVFSPREGVDAIWPGDSVVYSQRLGAERTKSRLNKITMSPLYKSMTIRSWSTTIKLLSILEELEKTGGKD